MSRYQFIELPEELVVEILKYLEVKTLLSCRQVCSWMNDVIKSSLELQYHVELVADGLEDGVGCSLSTAERFKLLMERREKWHNIEWKDVKQVPLYSHCQAYELTHGVFAISRGFGSHHLSLTMLPTSSQPARQVEREDLGMSIRDFAMDPSQDVVAFVAFEFHGTGITVHMRTLSDNKPHPKAARPRLEMPVSGTLDAVNFIQMADDIVAVYYHALDPGFIIWNWRTGRELVNQTRSELPTGTFDIALLSSRAYMVTVARGSGSIELFKFTCEDDSAATSPAGSSDHLPFLPPVQVPPPKQVALLGLPETFPGQDLRRFTTHSAPFVSNRTPGRPFETSRNSNVHVMELRYGDRALMFNLFVLNRFLLSFIDDDSNNVDTVPVIKHWGEWGPDNTRMMHRISHFQWLRYVYGSRVVFPPFQTGPTDFSLVLFDFNVHPNREGDNRGLLPSEVFGSGVTTSWESVYQDVHGADRVFVKDVVTRLPFRHSARRDVPNLENYTGFMIDEDRLLGLKTDNEDDFELNATLDVFMF